MERAREDGPTEMTGCLKEQAVNGRCSEEGSQTSQDRTARVARADPKAGPGSLGPGVMLFFRLSLKVRH